MYAEDHPEEEEEEGDEDRSKKRKKAENLLMTRHRTNQTADGALVASLRAARVWMAVMLATTIGACLLRLWGGFADGPQSRVPP